MADELKITVQRGGALLQVTGATGYEQNTAATMVRMIQALDTALGEAGLQLTDHTAKATERGPKMPSAMKEADEELVLTWLAQQTEPRSRTFTVKESPLVTRLTARRTKAALERLLQRGVLELRDYDYMGKDMKVRTYAAIYFADTEPSAE